MRLKSRSHRQSGDTIIEVIFAIVIFAFVAISGLALMNKGIAVGERALEVTLVRQQINAQAQALRYVHAANLASPSQQLSDTWQSFLTTYKETSASPYGLSSGNCRLPSGSSYKPFILNARTARVWGAPSIAPATGTNYPPYSQVIYNTDSSVKAAYGLWIESVPSSTPIVPRYVDFHIRACWPGSGSSVPMTIGTIVRLYVPA